MNKIYISNKFINRNGHEIEVTDFYEAIKHCRMALSYLIGTNQLWQPLLEWKHDLMAILSLYEKKFTIDDFISFRHKLTRIEYNQFINTFFETKSSVDNTIKNVYHYFDEHVIYENKEGEFRVNLNGEKIPFTNLALAETALYNSLFG